MLIHIINIADTNSLQSLHSGFTNNVINWIIRELPHAIGALIGLIFGAFITFFTQLGLKNRDLKSISLNNANYVSLILYKERASLKSIEDFIKDRDSKPHQKVFGGPSILSITQSCLEKILMYKKFYKFDYANTIQNLTSAEQSYRDCFVLIKKYNRSLQKLLEMPFLPQTAEILRLKDGYNMEVNSYVDNIKLKYEEAVRLNNNAREKFDSLCKNVFGRSYNKPLSAEIVKSIELC